MDEHGVALQNARIQQEERHINRRLRDEQDAAYQAALQADQVGLSFHSAFSSISFMILHKYIYYVVLLICNIDLRTLIVELFHEP